MDAGLGIILFLLQPGSFSNPHCAASLSIECSILRTALTAPSHRVQSMGVCTFYLCLLGTCHDKDPAAWVLAVPALRDQMFDLLYCSWAIITVMDHYSMESDPRIFLPQGYHLDKRTAPVCFWGKAPKWFKTLPAHGARRLAPRQRRKPSRISWAFAGLSDPSELNKYLSFLLIEPTSSGKRMSASAGCN
jgi:hypothetical protein